MQKITTVSIVTEYECDVWQKQAAETHWIFNEFCIFNIILIEKIVFIFMIAKSVVYKGWQTWWKSLSLRR